MKTNKPTREELENSRYNWRLLALLVIVGFILIDIENVIDIENDLQKENAELKEQIPVWTLKVSFLGTNVSNPSWCELNIHCRTYWGRYNYEWNYSSYEDYKLALNNFKEDCKEEWMRNCEVLP